MTSKKDRPIIEVKHLSKEYRIGMDRTYKRFSESFTNAVCHPLRTLRETTQQKDSFWALKDVNFEVERGEVLGIIGRNGAGKSTLLKVLSRITYPTEGEIVMRGRVGSLLEVGTGFHPELTGRENIYFNGAILGMKRHEIDDKFDEIMKFSGVEKFLDTPVKRYSSGMQVRLAFSVAAHLDPEILVVDEVLAVGDVDFQKKCLGKMGEVTEGGRTVLFVSHNMSAISSLCSKGLLLNTGRVEYMGDMENTIEKYMSKSKSDTSFDLTKIKHEDRPRKHVYITRLSLFNENFNPSYLFSIGDPMIIHISLTCTNQMKNAELGVKITSFQGLSIHLFSSSWEGLKIDLERGEYTFEVKIPKINLFPGKYYINCWISKPGQHSDDCIFEIGLIEILYKDITGYSPTFALYAVSGCEVYCPSKWKLISVV